MTVGDLIRELSRHNPDKRVLVDGYESGYDDIGRVRTENVVRDPRPIPYFGAFKDASSEDEDLPRESALILPR